MFKVGGYFTGTGYERLLLCNDLSLRFGFWAVTALSLFQTIQLEEQVLFTLPVHHRPLFIMLVWPVNPFFKRSLPYSHNATSAIVEVIRLLTPPLVFWSNPKLQVPSRAERLRVNWRQQLVDALSLFFALLGAIILPGSSLFGKFSLGAAIGTVSYSAIMPLLPEYDVRKVFAGKVLSPLIHATATKQFCVIHV